MGMCDALAGDAVVLAPLPVAFATIGGASCRDANFLNALNMIEFRSSCLRLFARLSLHKQKKFIDYYFIGLSVSIGLSMSTIACLPDTTIQYGLRR